MAQPNSFMRVATIMMIVLLASAGSAQTLVKSSDGTGSGWTTSPGVALTKSNDSITFPASLGWFRYDFPASTSSLEFVFNNGNGVWDNNGNANYKITVAGTWQVTSSVSIPPSATVLTAASDGTGLHVFFQTGWATPYIHYSTGSSWTTSPGQLMSASTSSEYPALAGWFQYTLPAPQASLEFVFNNGNGVWDNNNNASYKATSAGRWIVMSSVSVPAATKTSSPAPTTTPSPSSPASPTPTSTRAPTPTTPAPTPSGSCYNYNGIDSKWQTPPRNASGWSAEYQDYRSLTGYAHVVYGSSRTSATVTVRTYLRVASASCSYTFNGVKSTSPTYQVTNSLKDDLVIVATCTDGDESWKLEFDPVNFVWQNNAVNQPSGMKGGQKGAIVDLFGWPYNDIAQECTDFLGKAGYMGVKINPPQESVLTDAWPQSGQRNPWYFVYQPVSYRLYSRLGARKQLRTMIQTCRANGVRVYADAVVNHMSGVQFQNSPYYTHRFTYGVNAYTNARPALEFPAVPFGPTDFHCERSMSSWTDPLQLETGWLSGLTDLNTETTYVRERIAQYFVDLLGIGFSGLRLDALKHIGPVDTGAIFGLLRKYMGGSSPDDFISWGEVILGGEASLLACNANSGYNFYTGLDAEYAANGISSTDIAKLKIWSSDYPKEFPICGSWILPASRFVIQNDDHDQQNEGSSSRDMGDSGSVLIKDKDVAKHRSFEVKLFTRTDADWQIKVVLSSYTWFTNGAGGFPDGYSDCSGFDSSQGQKCTASVPYEKAFRAGSCGYTVDGFAGGKYTRVHRDLSIVNAMRSWVGLSSVKLSDLGITGSC
ncbi:Alpha amylase [Phytophthora infestans]|uniref:Alpha-amylase n=1 Tax=Phytophthora infestans TaxID=4787 RepID=A0A833WY63_PHYIN|nr:Alpha amylase [Phytophthora infestans]